MQFRLSLALSAVVGSLLVAGCGGASSAVSPPMTSSAPGFPTVATTSAKPGTFQNPVLSANLPDPSILQVGNTFHLYTTQSDQDNVQTAVSSDLVNWKIGPDALPTVGRWATSGRTWAPEVIAIGGRYVMFYTAADTASGRQCIGRAEADTADGPFVDGNARPVVCQSGLGGSIDPNPVAVGGKVFLYWKNDGNCCGETVSLWGQRMDATASTLIGKPTPLLRNTKAWQGNLVEAPEMVAHEGRYYLFYAANDYASTSYAEGYAVCRSPVGPCTDGAGPMLSSNAAAVGPGHGFIFTVGDRTWILYHAWPPDAVGSQQPGRQLWLDPVIWSPTGPTTTGPDAKPQAVPDVRKSTG